MDGLNFSCQRLQSVNLTVVNAQLLLYMTKSITDIANLLGLNEDPKLVEKAIVIQNQINLKRPKESRNTLNLKPLACINLACER